MLAIFLLLMASVASFEIPDIPKPIEAKIKDHDSCTDYMKKTAKLLGAEEDELLDLTSGPFTFFHPTKRAIMGFFRYWRRQGKPISRALLKSTLRFHFLNTTVYSKDIPAGTTVVPTLLTDPRYVNLGKNSSQHILVNKCDSTPPSISVVFGVPGWSKTTSNVVKADIPCKGGVVHLVDSVFWFPRYSSATLMDGRANAMLAALSSSDSTTLVDTTSNITVFVPVNEALEVILGAGPVDAKDVIASHVAKGAIFSPELRKQETLTMWNGKKIAIALKNGDVTVGGATVVLANVILRNGVMHVIDKVLKPAVGANAEI